MHALGCRQAKALHHCIAAAACQAYLPAPPAPPVPPCPQLEEGNAALLHEAAPLLDLLAADALEAAGLWEVGAALVVPLATGMAITATLLALRGTLPPTARCAEG